MEYAITNDTLLRVKNWIPIDKGLYDDALNARNRFFWALVLEEKIDFVVANFGEFEAELLERTLYNMLHSRKVYHAFDTMNSINRRILNFTAACRLYKDHVPQDVGKILGKNFSDDFSALCRTEYDANLCYRVMEEMRNYVQHRTLPITSLNTAVGLDGSSFNSDIRYLVSPKVEVSSLRTNDFKRSVLEELEGNGTDVDVKEMVRGYMGCLARIHLKIRPLVEEKSQESNTALAICKEKLFKSSTSDCEFHLLAHEDGKLSDRHYAKDRLTERRKWLVDKNPLDTQFSKSYVSGKVERKDSEV